MGSILSVFTATSFHDQTADVNNMFVQGITQQFLMLVPCLNPLIAIVTNTPYRNAAMFWRNRRKFVAGRIVVQSTAIQVQPANNRVDNVL